MPLFEINDVHPILDRLRPHAVLARSEELRRLHRELVVLAKLPLSSFHGGRGKWQGHRDDGDMFGERPDQRAIFLRKGGKSRAQRRFPDQVNQGKRNKAFRPTKKRNGNGAQASARKPRSEMAQESPSVVNMDPARGRPAPAQYRKTELAEKQLAAYMV